MVKKLNFLSDRWIVLKFGLSRRAYFSLQNSSLQGKIKVKTNEISLKYQKNPYKIFTFFLRKTGLFLPNFAQINYIAWARTRTSRLDDICFELEDVNFSKKKKVIEFFNSAPPSFWAQYLNDHISKLSEARTVEN